MKSVIEFINHSYIRIHSEPSIYRELKEKFTFEVPGAKFTDRVKNRVWDGKISLFNLNTRQIYTGLLDDVISFFRENEYDFELDNFPPDLDVKVDYPTIERFCKDLKIRLPDNGEMYDYQIDYLVNAINSKRATSLAATSAGKSVIIYSLYRYYNKKTLFIVDRISLVNQILSNFNEYGYDTENNCALIYSGKDKNIDKNFISSTWQSIVDMPEEWFKQFDVVIWDEAHKASAKSAISIMNKLYECKYRFAFTGTIDGSKGPNETTIKGLFGPIYKGITLRELINSGRIVEPKITFVYFEYNDTDRKLLKKNKFNSDFEENLLCTHVNRNDYIKNLTINIKGVTLVLFSYIDHGKELFEKIKSSTDIPVFYVSGEVKGTKREEIRKDMANYENAIIVASIQTFGEGINIRNINNIILSFPIAGSERLLQALGRGLRKYNNKFQCNIYDLCDDLSSKSKLNSTLKRMVRRAEIYAIEQLKYKIVRIKL